MDIITNPTTVRRIVGIASVFGALSLAVSTVIGRPLVGVGVFVLAVGAVVLAQLQADTTVFDERDEEISKNAASMTLMIFGITSALVFPTLTVAWGLGQFEWEPWSTAIAMLVAVLYLTYGAFGLVIGRQR